MSIRTAKKDAGDVTYAKQSHHGDRWYKGMAIYSENGDGHDGPMVEPELLRPQLLTNL